MADSSSSRLANFFNFSTDSPVPAFPRKCSREFLSPLSSSPSRVSSLSGAVFSLSATVLGGGILSLPFCFSLLGLGFGTAFLIVLAAASDFSIYILISCSRRVRHGASYSEVVSSAFGSWAGKTVGVLMTLFVYLCIVAYLILFRDLASPLVELIVYPAGSGAHLPPLMRTLVVLALVVGLMPFCLRTSMASLSGMSMASIASMIILAYCVAWRGVQSLIVSINSPSTYSEPLKYTPAHWRDAVYAAPILACAYFAHFNVLPLHRELIRPTRPRIKAMIHGVIFFCTGLYWIVGVAGYLFARGDTDGNILNNFEARDPLATVGRISLLLTCAGGFPMIVLPCRELLGKVMWMMFPVYCRTIAAVNVDAIVDTKVATDDAQSADAQHNNVEVVRASSDHDVAASSQQHPILSNAATDIVRAVSHPPPRRSASVPHFSVLSPTTPSASFSNNPNSHKHIRQLSSSYLFSHFSSQLRPSTHSAQSRSSSSAFISSMHSRDLLLAEVDSDAETHEYDSGDENGKKEEEQAQAHAQERANDEYRIMQQRRDAEREWRAREQRATYEQQQQLAQLNNNGGVTISSLDPKLSYSSLSSSSSSISTLPSTHLLAPIALAPAHPHSYSSFADFPPSSITPILSLNDAHGNNGVDDDNDNDMPDADFEEDQDVPFSERALAVQTVAICASALLISTRVSSVAVLWNLCGSSFCLMLGYIVPSACYLSIRRDKPLGLRMCATWLMLVVGVLALMVCGSESLTSITMDESPSADKGVETIKG